MSIISESLRAAVDACANPGSEPLPFGDDGEPVFAEPWQAQAFVSTVALSQGGLFSWKRWVEVFAAEIAARPQVASESAADAYFRQWLSALERLLDSLGVASHKDIVQTQEHWRRSYINTPHGHPVEFGRHWPAPGPELERALSEHGHHHHHEDDLHDAAPRPIAVSPSREPAA
jgi:nitrile hydratase accessory protein